MSTLTKLAYGAAWAAKNHGPRIAKLARDARAIIFVTGVATAVVKPLATKVTTKVVNWQIDRAIAKAQRQIKKEQETAAAKAEEEEIS